MIAHRDRLAREWGLTLLVGRNETALAAGRTYPEGAVSRTDCCSLLKTEALTRTLSGEGPRLRLDLLTGAWEPFPDREPYTGVIVGLRADEEGSRSKGNGTRYRSLGCAPCTAPVRSDARNPREIVEELRSGQFARVAERSGRAQDLEDDGGLETLPGRLHVGGAGPNRDTRARSAGRG